MPEPSLTRGVGRTGGQSTGNIAAGLLEMLLIFKDNIDGLGFRLTKKRYGLVRSY